MLYFMKICINWMIKLEFKWIYTTMYNGKKLQLLQFTTMYLNFFFRYICILNIILSMKFQVAPLIFLYTPLLNFPHFERNDNSFQFLTLKSLLSCLWSFSAWYKSKKQIRIFFSLTCRVAIVTFYNIFILKSILFVP